MVTHLVALAEGAPVRSMRLNTEALEMLAGLLERLGCDQSWLDTSCVPGPVARDYARALEAAVGHVWVSCTDDPRYEQGRRKELVLLASGTSGSLAGTLDDHQDTRAWLLQFTAFAGSSQGFWLD